MNRAEVLARQVERMHAVAFARECAAGRTPRVREALSTLADGLAAGRHIPGAVVVLAPAEQEAEAPPVARSPSLSVDEVELTLGRMTEERELAVSAENARGAYRAVLRRWSNGPAYVLVGRYQRRDDGTLGPVKGGRHLALAPDELRAVAAALLEAATAVESEPRTEVREAS